MSNHIQLGLEDDDKLTQLLQIMRTHVKLALEYYHSVTTRERKEKIKVEIELLRNIRDDLLNESRTNGINEKLSHQ